jgi:NAD(P)-dependent dehydrogenase (short-subunit alcohol dehydrogenase family)
MTNRILTITGASGGLGSLVAKNEQANFDEIVLIGRTRPKLESLARELGAKAHIVQSDLGDEKKLRDALSPFPSIDGLVNAAGVLGPVARFGEGSWDEWKRAIETNLIGNAAACRAAIPKLLESRRGKIVNFSGGGAAGVRTLHSAYAASKTAMVRLTEIIADEYPQLDANIIAPGAHNTGIWKTETHDKPPAKWADAARFTATVSFLLSGKSDGITGKFIHINDRWETFGPEISKTDLYALRRNEPKR